MSKRTNFCIRINGIVQSVGFRPFIKNLADEMEICGSVQNLSSAGVEIILHATKNRMEEFVANVSSRKPVLSEIHDVTINDIGNSFTPNEFIIKPSAQTKENKFSALPPDISICADCQNDMLTEKNRMNYPFTSCTNCGPRYSTISSLPYDRINTMFENFSLCDDCLQEYTDPKNRRFHAQTTCCEKCGPKYQLLTTKKDQIPLNWEFVRDLLKDGKILSILGQGGSHFACDALNTNSVATLRQNRRKNSKKPFGVMMSDIETVKTYCHMTKSEELALTSIRRPIIILKARDPNLWKEVSPGLSTIGVMLPYAGIHHLLFDNELKALIMTSANLPGIPMPIDAESLINASQNISEYVLTHNLTIHQRNDDSVIRIVDDLQKLIRRSRGYTPQPFFVMDFVSLPHIAAVGAEENDTISLLKDGWIIPSQHIGNVRNLETLSFIDNTVKHLTGLYHVRPKVWIDDLHPSFLTSTYAREQSNHVFGEISSVQHHVSHVASLALDNHVTTSDPVLAWACDGYGYGYDGTAWGCELILLENGSFKRLGTSIPVDYRGGDQNAKYPGRMLVKYMLSRGINPDEFFKDYDKYFPEGLLEYSYLKQSYSLAEPHQTHSLGRFFDSVSTLLDITALRTYHGEPAIKLEDVALRNNSSETPVNTDDFVSTYKGLPVIDLPAIFESLYMDYKSGINKTNIAYHSFNAVSDVLLEIGIQVAKELEIPHLGFTGGIAYNRIMTNKFHKTLDTYNLKFLQHKDIPSGDGGISLGQIYYWGKQQND